MFHLDNNSGVSAMPPVGAVQSSAPRWYTEGGGGTPASYPGADWYNIVQAELLNLLSSYGITPNKSDFNQLQKAIEEAIKQKATASSALLTAIAALVTSADKMPYFTGKDKVAMTDLTGFARTLLGRSDAAGVLSDLGLVDASGIVGRLVNIQVITSTQQYVPTTGARRIISILTGGGAGGAPANAATTSQIYSGGGGGAGGTAIGIFTLSAISNFLVTVGSGGASNNAGGNSTAFGMTARGGLPGTNNVGTSSSAGGFGSDSSGGLINLPGGDGCDGQAATRLVGGTGGSSFWGGSGRSGSGNGAPGKAPGSGGGGARDDQLSGTAYAGGTGADGVCLILEFA
ncbi:glycine-rich domain-containing protein [Citrobacter sp. Igbk 14]|uniref:glycine-rich domain-containing protein n=1 Tax=Citrobacter sp. Igbk 14 TaxID=2963960 RepID=UPI0023044F6C|nr:carbohydrate kinase [Citrobacter sp. Igbk 14]MDA8510903.1 carbohydrate kinase [Citrobacter sp. Igbk 14]